MSRTPGNSGYSRPDSLRIGPPVVRERAPYSPGAAPGGLYRGPSAPQYRPPSGGSSPGYRAPSGGSSAPRPSSPPASSGGSRSGGGHSTARR
jgi:hypothetical protein